ncbi:MAG: hypothetical protein IJR58_06160 [Lachnospiraceae bacterium]|nr:hypothetical protein [Lachnospiraceae bacterium]
MTDLILIISMIFLSITIIFCLLRAALGPRMTDRLVAVNIISIKGVVLILLMGAYLHDNQFMDIALVYVLLSFLAVVCLARNMLTKAARKEKEETDGTV